MIIMKEPLVYIIESIICSGLFFALYQLFVMRFTGYKVNRLFLLLGVFISCIIPMLSIPVWEGSVVNVPIVETMEVSYVGNETMPYSDVNVYDIVSSIIGGIYLSGVIFLLLSHIIKFYKGRVGNVSKISIFDNYNIVEAEKIKTPFSFLRTIYIPIIQDEKEKRLIIEHEYSHISHFHSYERIFLEIHKLAFWFNPFVWLSMRKLVEIQEMEADSDVINNGADVTDYRLTLLKQVLGVQDNLVCNLSGHPLKKRFLAMTMKRAEQNARILLLIPFLVIALVVFGFVQKPVEIQNTDDTIINERLQDNNLSESIVTGVITDFETGKPIVGAVLMSRDRKGTVADSEGRFIVKAKEGTKYEILYPDYEKGILVVGEGKEQINNIKLQKSSKVRLEKNQPQKIDMKNSSLLIIVGGEIYYNSLNNIPSNSIKTMKVVKGSAELSSYIEKYGDVARNGVIEIVLKE